MLAFLKQGKVRKNVTHLELIFAKSLPWPKETCGSKLSLFAIYFNSNIVCKNV
jgi:hypothetical protein